MLNFPLTVLFSFLFQSSTNELSRQNAVVRQLKQENEAANEQIRLLQDKYVLLKYLFLNPSFIIPYFFAYKTVFFPFQNNPKNLDPSYKTDLDLWDCLGRVKPVLQQK